MKLHVKTVIVVFILSTIIIGLYASIPTCTAQGTGPQPVPPIVNINIPSNETLKNPVANFTADLGKGPSIINVPPPSAVDPPSMTGLVPSNSTAPQKALSALSNIIGINVAKQGSANLTQYQKDPYLNMIPQESLRYTVASNGNTVDMLLTFTNDSLRMVNVLNDSLNTIRQNLNVADLAKIFMGNYQNYTGNFFYSQIKSQLEIANADRNLTIISGNTKFEEISIGNDTTFKWTYVINGIEAPDKCVALRYENGFLKYFVDNWNIYKIGSTTVNLSEKEAINIAMAKAKDYSPYAGSDNATERSFRYNVTNAMMIETILAPSLYVNADKAHSSNLFELYPLRHIWVSLDKFYPGNVYGFNVYVWADTKEVCYIHERISTTDPPADLVADYTSGITATQLQTRIWTTLGSLPINLVLIALAIAVVTVPLFFKFRKGSTKLYGLPKPPFLKITGILLCVLLFSVVWIGLSASFVSASPYNGRATIWGAESVGAWNSTIESSWRKQYNDEVIDQRNTTSYISNLFTLNGYSATDNQGTKNQTSNKGAILTEISSNEAAYSRVAVVDFDHGNGKTNTTSAIPGANLSEFHYLFEDNYGTRQGPVYNTDDSHANEHAVFDAEIYNRTSGKTFFAFINTCNSAHVNQTFWGSDISTQGLVDNSRARGMPFSWTHKLVGTNSSNQPAGYMSADGYHYPDGNANCYIGFFGGSAALQQTVNGTGFQYNYWVYRFFYYALTADYTIHQALDLASHDTFSGSPDFDQTPLYQTFTAIWPIYNNGQWKYAGAGISGNGQMKVYGNANLKLYQPTLSVFARDNHGTLVGAASFYVDSNYVGQDGSSLKLIPMTHTFSVSVPSGYRFDHFHFDFGTSSADEYTNPVSMEIQHNCTVTAYFRPLGLNVESYQSWYWGQNTVVSSVAVGDVDGDGGNEVVTGGYYFDGMRKVAQLIEWDGSTLALKRQTSWYWTSDTVVNSVAIGDVDGDGAKEIVTGGSYNNGVTNCALLHVWNGITMAVKNYQGWLWTSNTVVNSVAVADVDGDSFTEIVTGGSYNNGVTDIAMLNVWVIIGGTLTVKNSQAWLWNSNTRVSSLAIADVDGDGYAEIATGGSYFDGTRLVALLNIWNGASLAPEQAQSWYWGGNTTVNSMAIGNVDNDPQVEIVAGGYFFDGTRKVALLHEWIDNGVSLSVERCVAWYWTSNTEVLSVALGDVDGNFRPEIITGGYYHDGTRELALLQVWDGSSLATAQSYSWYTTSNTRVNATSTGNLDADSAIEIATGGYYYDLTRLNAQLVTWEDVA